MSPRNLRRTACLSTAVLAVLLTAVPAYSQTPNLAIVYATDNMFIEQGGGPADVTIGAGGHVNFSYFQGNSRHNVVFPGPRPTVCGVSFGPEGNSAALPAQPSPSLWEAGCDFEVPGTYAFVCGLHPTMTGSVTVTTTRVSPPPDAVEVPPVGFDADAAGEGARIALSQRGTSVRGSVLVARNGSRVLARAFARRRALTPGSRSALDVQVGRRLRTSVGAGRASFTVPLNAAARSALRRNGRLLIKLRLTVSAAGGGTYNATRTVVMRPR